MNKNKISRPQTAANKENLDDLKSQKSYAGSQASYVSRVSRPKSQYGGAPSQMTQSKAASDSDAEEEDEWAAIQKFNALLHYEEQKAMAKREAERRRLMKIELDQQKEAKLQKKMKEKAVDGQWDVAQKEHIKLLDQKETDKQLQLQKKIQNEKMMRDTQLKKNQERKKKEAKDNLVAELTTVKRLQQEMQQERETAIKKKQQEKEYFSKIMAENDRNKAHKMKLLEKEKREDHQQFLQMESKLKKQDQDKKNEIAAREARAQAFQNHMADGVLKGMDAAAKREEEMIAKYVAEKEKKLRRADDKKATMLVKQKEQIKNELGNQQADKQKREKEEKKNINQQADMWKQEREIWQVEDKRIQDKIKKINADTQAFLKAQTDEKFGKKKKMNPAEKAYNKGLMKEIKEKQRIMKKKMESEQMLSETASQMNDRME